ncbi:MAG: ATP-binding protein [Patescibacteria group bacterium]
MLDLRYVCDGGILDFSSFVGRTEEKKQIKKVIEQGSVRSMIVGSAGVGKTSLLNYVREMASKDQYFTTAKEIELNKPISCNEFVIITLSAIYEELKRRNLSVSPELTENLEALYSLTSLTETLSTPTSLTQLNYNKLSALLQKTLKEIISPRFKGVILHYDNLDNIKEWQAIHKLFGEIRDLLYNTPNVIFFFVGNRFLPKLISLQPRVRQIFLMPPIEIFPLELENVKEILKKRVDALKLKNATPIPPHTDKALDVLFKLHNGNLREILNSLSNCVMELPPSNSPIQINEFSVRELLFNKVDKTYLSKLTDVEKGILSKIIDSGAITPSAIAKLTGKTRQNISSKYLPKLEDRGVIEFKGSEGIYRYYEVCPELKWWKLEMNEKEKMKAEQIKYQKTSSLINKKLTDFM